MDITQAKARMASFLDGKELTFSIEQFPSGEWTAQCNEIPGIITGGTGDDITNSDTLMRDAIVAAAGVDPEFINDVIKFVGYRDIPHTSSQVSSMTAEKKKEAEYVLH